MLPPDHGKSPTNVAGASTQSFGRASGSGAFCRDVFELGDKYFYAGASPKTDARPAVEMSVSK